MIVTILNPVVISQALKQCELKKSPAAVRLVAFLGFSIINILLQESTAVNPAKLQNSFYLIISYIFLQSSHHIISATI